MIVIADILAQYATESQGSEKPKAYNFQMQNLMQKEAEEGTGEKPECALVACLRLKHFW